MVIPPYSTQITNITVENNAEINTEREYSFKQNPENRDTGIFCRWNKDNTCIIINNTQDPVEISPNSVLGNIIPQNCFSIFKQEFKFSFGKQLSLEQIKKLQDILGKYEAVFKEKRVKYDPGSILKRQQPRRTSKLHDDFIKKTIQENLEDNIITESFAHCAAPVVIVPKGDNGLRFCVDKNRLIQELFGAFFILEFDLISAFWQRPMEESSKVDFTTFTCKYGIFKYNVMPFGLCNASSTQQRAMDFIDNVIIATKTFEKHLKALKNAS
eukprot:TRINITY_DN1981_c0_g2_i23.p1 TRINITY_DN1981_c0_g2~~TRINITY_DN1981_c0_g2_i23.p1  ORF type:complete len:270 (+),score=57.70 TRINITY_DN1981_c0_g2_i23:1295-2104(+)